MKEVKKCSISGVAFTMDADAYEALETYLESLKTTYKDTADGAEIVADIEARIAELILSAQDNTRIVEKPLILNIGLNQCRKGIHPKQVNSSGRNSPRRTHTGSMSKYLPIPAQTPPSLAFSVSR